MLYRTEFSKSPKFCENLLQIRRIIRTETSQFTRNVFPRHTFRILKLYISASFKAFPGVRIVEERREKAREAGVYSPPLPNPQAYYSLATLRASRVFTGRSPTIRTPGTG